MQALRSCAAWILVLKERKAAGKRRGIVEVGIDESLENPVLKEIFRGEIGVTDDVAQHDLFVEAFSKLLFFFRSSLGLSSPVMCQLK